MVSINVPGVHARSSESEEQQGDQNLVANTGAPPAAMHPLGQLAQPAADSSPDVIQMADSPGSHYSPGH